MRVSGQGSVWTFPQHDQDLETPACGPPAFARPSSRPGHTIYTPLPPQQSPPFTATPQDREAPVRYLCTQGTFPWIGTKHTNVNTTPQPSPPQRGPHGSIASQYGRCTVNKDQIGLQGRPKPKPKPECQLKAKNTNASPLKNRFVPLSSSTLTSRQCPSFSVPTALSLVASSRFSSNFCHVNLARQFPLL